MKKVVFSAVESAMACSSLGYGAAYALLQPCDHAWLHGPGPDARPVVVESGASLWSYDVIFVSAAWELELPALVRALRTAGIEPFAVRRPTSQPLLVGGGPLTLSNPDLLGAVCDAVFAGEADAAFPDINQAVHAATGRLDLLSRLASIPGMWIPSSVLACPEPVVVKLPETPLFSAFPEMDNLFSGSFVVEVGRGCPRGCSFCVAFGGRRPRFYPADRIINAVPDGTSRVGLLGAAVSDHPELNVIVSAFRDRGIGVTLGSLRADRVEPELVSMLAAGGLRTLTVAADGASEGLRRSIHKGVTAEHLLKAARIARETGIDRMRVYVMLGLPGEQSDDVVEFAELVNSMAAMTTVVVSVSPFVPKRFTPLATAPFAGVGIIRRRISDLRRMVAPGVQIKAGSVKEALFEYTLSHARMHEIPDLTLY